MAGTHDTSRKRTRTAAALILSAFLLALPARAGTHEFDLTSTEYFDRAASTGLWNTAEGRIQAAVAPGGDATRVLDFGDGSDGAFVDGAEHEAIAISGNTVNIDTNLQSDFAFSSFVLSAGKTLTATGNNPLKIRVAGVTEIEGTIDLSGAGGKDNNAAISAGSGGDGIAGGMDGGSGGNPGGSAGEEGDPTTATFLAGGEGGLNSAIQDSGGGGGCNGTGPDAGNDASGAPFAGLAGVCTSQRSQIASNLDSEFTGGAGGGGGGALLGPPDFPGGGGGAGGGAIWLISLGQVVINGQIQAIGGDGGDPLSDNGGGVCGGGGGGGAGGSVWIQTASTVSGTGSIDVSGGIGGLNLGCSSGAGAGGFGEGGNGSRGVVRVDSSSGSAWAGTAPAASSDQNLLIQAPSEEYSIVSLPLDFSGGYFSYDTPDETIGCGTDGEMVVEYQGSKDGVRFDKTVTGSEISKLANDPFVRFRVTITPTGANPPCLTGLSFRSERSVLDELTLDGGGLFCGSIHSPSKGTGRRNGAAGMVDLALIALVAFLATRRKQTLIHTHPG